MPQPSHHRSASASGAGAGEEAIRMERLGKLAQNGAVTAGTGDSQTGINKRSLYEHNGVAVCSQKRALVIATVVFATLFVISIIIAYAGPQSDCPCAGEKPEHLENEATPNTTASPVPLATNGEIFPWNSVRLPTFVHPTRYSISIHPNLTTLDVKGQVIIEFTVEKETPFIVFHSKNLTLAEKKFPVLSPKICGLPDIMLPPHGFRATTVCAPERRCFSVWNALF